MDIVPYLQDIEARLDPAVENALEEEWRRFTFGTWDEPVFAPARPRPAPPGIEWPSVTVNKAMDDFDAMALQQLRMCSQVLADGGGALLSVRCNYGTGILPSVFGAELFVMDEELNTLPTTRPLAGGADAMRRLLDRGMPDIRAGLGARTFEMAERFRKIMAPYPKTLRYVHIYHPDVQGPMDVCELLWGSGLFIDVADYPALVKDVLELITAAYIAFMREWEKIVPFEGDATVHWGMMHRGRVMLRDDSAMNFSPEMYREFIQPYDQRVLDAFMGGAIHFCGRGDHYIADMCSSRGVYAIAMSQPHLNDMDRIYRSTIERGIKLIGFPSDEARRALASGRDLLGHVHCADPSFRHQFARKPA